jgi:hypothetical protein
MESEDCYIKSPTMAMAYLDRRAEDARQLRAELLNLDYVAVRIEPNGEVLVGTTRCKSVTCALAYILRRWW